MRARLLLANGTAVEGCGFGAEGFRVGEVVFTTAMTGYPESLTDSSYRGQILLETHPMVGNYGVPSSSRAIYGIPLDYESDNIQAEGLIVAELPKPNHYSSAMSLHEWLSREGVPGMYKVDTRMLVKGIREHGTLMGAIATYREGDEPSWGELAWKLKGSKSYDEIPLAYRVTPPKPITHRPSNQVRGRIAVLDCGVKHSILIELLRRGFSLTRYPCDTPAGAITENADGVVLSNGPGNPARLKKPMEVAAELATYGRKPILAICLGMQLLSLGLGAKTYKLPYGHRGVNKPVVEEGTGQYIITTHNHGYAVDPETINDTGLKPWFWQPDDGTLEGLRSDDGLILATQFHPEAGPDPWDATKIFDTYERNVRNARKLLGS